MRSIARQRPTRVPIRPPNSNARRWNTTEAGPHQPLQSILIANRGEIALRVGRTAASQGIRTTTLYTDPDRNSQHALSSPFAINLGSTDQYLNGARIIELAKEHGIQAIHPGYGFLSENSGFAKACTDAGINFIGPPWKAIDAMGDKARSKEIMTEAGVPCIPGYHGAEQDPKRLEREAEQIGYPVLLKAVKGGGGKGMRIVQDSSEFRSQLDSAKSEARSSFGDDVMLVEKYITTPRHIEVQVFADKHGNCLALGERDCSIQRRHQKILEESPAPNLAEEIRQDLWEKARQAALAVGYEGAGTVEFIFDNDTGKFFFMEMNTRLQVEHPVTEMVTGLDLVAWQILVAEGKPLPLTQAEVETRIQERGHAIEARIYAEDPSLNFLPSTGKLLHIRTPKETESVRIDAGFVQGDEVSSHYDPMIAKLIVSGTDRRAALQRMERALEGYEIAGPVTNIDFVRRVVRSEDFANGEVETGYIAKHSQELFGRVEVQSEVWMQAAIGLYEAQLVSAPTTNPPSRPLSTLGFGNAPQPRRFELAEISSDPQVTPTPVSVLVLKTGPETYQVSLADKTHTITSTYDHRTNILHSYYPHTRLETRLILSPPTTTTSTEITLFQHSRLHRLRLLPPPFLAKALGQKDVANSVVAPMPCKVLRVEVEAGEEVKKGQALVVVESMKMEMVVRSPSQGVVRRVVHLAGEICKAGVVLVEFEEGEGQGVGEGEA
ncbi:hypothetical protein LTR62_003851 [Meristemomyces frigidus]|uniref:Uncharacterized protein n=1 Tax=Meristemomyces frigidus TaxID=1508187 RepID=A0AAN7YKA8_9PEZI|nr:hypothetical protein LTR62_003851 [Meristemomyces frigidus]